MIPEEQVGKLKQFKNIKNRIRTTNGHVKHHAKKLHLTKQQRNFSSFPIRPGINRGIGGPKHYREYVREYK